MEEPKKLPKQQSKDPFEAAFEEEQEQDQDEDEEDLGGAGAGASGATTAVPRDDDDRDRDGDRDRNREPSSSSMALTTAPPPLPRKKREDDDEEEEENVEVELEKFPSASDPHKMAKMQAILSQFSEEQMSRYESFRRAGFQKSNMKRLLASITGTQKISVPLTIVVSGIAKMFVGELVETARMVMTERKESGPVRPCHIREAYRRLKMEGKVPKRSVPRLFR
ncbi:transcription initiation factor TFIID subunit 11 [Humulus lupulus]|uniref:transcription initiation factor TFIID subunit 11 n=1 Tax=Humulus lupulus TaxID=3486 RepID=UPI002B40CAD2|nr:transcription initiation factor TFIID subunit 11 [Humulus lupulus]